MRIAMHICPTKFLLARSHLLSTRVRILDIGCGNYSPSTTVRWFPGCHYSGADIQAYNLTEQDLSAMKDFYPLGVDGSGYAAIPDGSYDLVILHHVLEHMLMPEATLPKICAKLKPGGFIWIAFPSVTSLSLPSAEGTLQFCDDATHVYIPGVRETSNILLRNGIKVLHAGRTKDSIRTAIGAAILPFAFLRRLITGRLSAKGLWYIFGFEDHVFGQRRN